MTQFFIDTANFDEVWKAVETGITGVTTNPAIASKEEDSYFTLIEKISKIKELKHISVEPLFFNRDDTIKDIVTFMKIDERIVIKCPPTMDGMGIANWCKNNRIRTNVTAVMSWPQADAIFKLGVDYISVFYGRVGDCGYDPISVIKDVMAMKRHEAVHSDKFQKDLKDMVSNYGNTSTYDIPEPIVPTKVIIGSIRGVYDVSCAITTLPDIITIPFKIYEKMLNHPKSIQTIDEFNKLYKEKQNGK